MGRSGMKEMDMWVVIIGSIVLLSGVTGITIYQDVFAGGGKVTICHKPGTPAENTITVSESAVPAHQAHGDTIGACGGGSGGDGISKISCTCGDGIQPQICTEIDCNDGSGRVTFCDGVCASLGGNNGDSCVPDSCALP